MTRRTADEVRADIANAKRAKIVCEAFNHPHLGDRASKKIATLRAELAAIERNDNDRAG